MKKMNAILITSALSLMLFGCSASVSTDGGATAPSTPVKEFMDERATIQGPDINGTWESDCNYDRGSANYRIFQMTMKDGTVTRTMETFKDSSCKEFIQKKTNTGKFRFIEKLRNEIYAVEYAFDLGQGARAFPQENIRKDEDMILIGNFHVGEGMGVLEDEPLHLVTPDQPDDQTPQVAQPAKTYAEAKYAICELQRSVLMVDLSALNLTGSGSATVQFASPVCGKEVKWSAKKYTANVVQKNGYPQITFSTSSTDGIETWDTGTGLEQNGYIRRPYAVIGGNSGYCYFLKTPVIRKLSPFCD